MCLVPVSMRASLTSDFSTFSLSQLFPNHIAGISQVARFTVEYSKQQRRSVLAKLAEAHRAHDDEISRWVNVKTLGVHWQLISRLSQLDLLELGEKTDKNGRKATLAKITQTGLWALENDKFLANELRSYVTLPKSTQERLSAIAKRLNISSMGELLDRVVLREAEFERWFKSAYAEE